jgi:hypothetical protein
MLSISEIGEKYEKKKRILVYLLLPIILLMFITIVALVVFKEPQYLLVFYSLIFILIILIFFVPKISTFELIRYHLSELVKSLDERSFKKSEDHLNELAYNIKEFDNELDDNFILNSTKTTLTNFWYLLKFKVYPSIKQNEYGSYVETFRDIDFAFKNGDIGSLNRIIETFDTGIHNEDILLPYEKPPIRTRIINKVSVAFNSSLIFRFICFTFVSLIIANHFFPLDNTTFFGAGGISAVLAAAYNSKI